MKSLILDQACLFVLGVIWFSEQREGRAAWSDFTGCHRTLFTVHVVFPTLCSTWAWGHQYISLYQQTQRCSKRQKSNCRTYEVIYLFIRSCEGKSCWMLGIIDSTVQHKSINIKTVPCRVFFFVFLLEYCTVRKQQMGSSGLFVLLTANPQKDTEKKWCHRTRGKCEQGED